MRKQLLAFVNGSPNEASTWSNVPFMFLTALRRVKPDIDVLTCDIRLEDSSLIISLLSRLWNHLLTPRLGPLYTFDRTDFYHSLVRRRMCAAEQDLSGGGALLTFDFSNPAPMMDGYKVCLLCDWTIDYEIREHQRRRPTRWEDDLIRRQKDLISEVDEVTVLFPYSARLIREACEDANVSYLGLPANLPEGVSPNFSRGDSNRIVFVGKPAYEGSLRTISHGLTLYNQTHPQRRLRPDVIGMDGCDGVDDSCVSFLGYLRKNVDEECSLYYSTVRNALALVSISEVWVGASSVVETMALGTPVVISPNRELSEMLPCTGWGYWCPANPFDFNRCLESLTSLSSDDLERMCRKSYEVAEGCSWDAFISKWCNVVGL
ncbi:hypothetical protein ACTQXJ_07200 [Collinsella sp. LCP19S3_C6]|uniref:hypothetical protein n=1 Tax=unclassified Collinsella TaxID=2637548 RepID=UPI003F8C84B7